MSAEPGKSRGNAELKRLHVALEDSRRELARTQSRLEEAHASTSWRITRPLRATRTLLDRLQRRTSSAPAQIATDGNNVPANLDEDAIVRNARAWAAERSVQSGSDQDELGGELESHVKLIAFYLPQFHPIPENDLFWGPGFTDWRNVVRARPIFEGHYQPQLPSELGFYDLRLPEVLERQAALAREYGVHGFCFHYYWFDGHRVLERPLEQLMVGNSELPFCCCWANENWTRRWDGRENQVLLRQRYEAGWAERLIRDLLPVMTDARYIRVRAAPLLLVYRVDELPDPRRTAELWREIARREAGFELHLAAVQSFGIEDPRPFGFDAAVEFPPHPFSYPAPATKPRKLDREFAGILTDYRAIRRRALDKALPEYAWYRGLVPAWDNTARRGRRALILLESSPDAYRAWLRTVALQTLCRGDAQEPFVFVNAWNEWAEGTHLEPDDRYGRQWLEATRAGLADGVQAYAAVEGRELSQQHISPGFAARSQQ